MFGTGVQFLPFTSEPPFIDRHYGLAPIRFDPADFTRSAGQSKAAEARVKCKRQSESLDRSITMTLTNGE
jgi:hypothetical protein